VTSKEMFFEAELPSDIKELIEKWRKYVSSVGNKQ
jgi:hypothetical protein